MGVFDQKNFNSEVFGKYVESVPRVKMNALLKAGALRTRGDLKSMLSAQTGGNFISVPMTGRVHGTALNYDGATDITTSKLTTYLQSMIVVGRAYGFEELDFSYDITGGHDFMADIARQVSDFWDDEDESTILSILEGIFGVTTDGFSTKHTLDITADTVPVVGATTLNNAIQKAGGDNKNLFTTVIMHSAVATNLENLQILEYWKQTDSNGIQRSTTLANWNGRTVLIDDNVPTSVDGTSGDTTYTTYIFGQGAFDYCDCGVKVPYAVARVEEEDGGKDKLCIRQRKLFAPRGFSFVQPSTPIMSPTNAQLATTARWTIVKGEDNSYFNSKAIPFARILSKG